MTLNQSATQYSFAKINLCVLAVDGNGHFGLSILHQKTLQQCGRLLGKNERSRNLALDGENAVANQLMTIAGHNGKTVGGEVEVDSVHHRTNLVLADGKEGAVDALGQIIAGDAYRGGFRAHGHYIGEIFSALDGHG